MMPMCRSALCLLAQAQARSGHAEEAAVAFDRLVQSSTAAESLCAAAEVLIDKQRYGEARDLVETILAAARLDDPSDDVQPALEGELGMVGERRADEHLADDGLDRRRARARDVVVDRDVAPAEQRLSLVLDRLLDDALDLAAAIVRAREEDDADRVAAAVGSSRPAAARMNSSGTWMRIPAPSPVSTSAPLAPRCSRWSSTSSARSTVRWLALPVRHATAPTPQLSCSKFGS